MVRKALITIPSCSLPGLAYLPTGPQRRLKTASKRLKRAFKAAQPSKNCSDWSITAAKSQARRYNMTILDKIVQQKKKEVEQLKRQALPDVPPTTGQVPSITRTFHNTERMNIIAE